MRVNRRDRGPFRNNGDNPCSSADNNETGAANLRRIQRTELQDTTFRRLISPRMCTWIVSRRQYFLVGRVTRARRGQVNNGLMGHLRVAARSGAAAHAGRRCQLRGSGRAGVRNLMSWSKAAGDTMSPYRPAERLLINQYCIRSGASRAAQDQANIKEYCDSALVERGARAVPGRAKPGWLSSRSRRCSVPHLPMHRNENGGHAQGRRLSTLRSVSA